jgi:hypothetical protein
MSGLAQTSPGGPLFRLAHSPNPWDWPPWEYCRKANRGDDPTDTYRVLYIGPETASAADATAPVTTLEDRTGHQRRRGGPHEYAEGLRACPTGAWPPRRTLDSVIVAAAISYDAGALTDCRCAIPPPARRPGCVPRNRAFALTQCLSGIIAARSEWFAARRLVRRPARLFGA